MRTHAVRPLLALALAIFLLPACESTEPSPALQPGTYALVSVNGRPLPASPECSGTQVLERRIVLGADRAATYWSREARGATGAEVTYQAAGRLRQSGDRLEVSLRGGWSDESTLHDSRFVALIEPAALMQSGVGSPCDGNSTLRYQLIQAQ